MNTGHRGTLATIHASSADEAVRRLAMLALRAGGGVELATLIEEVRRSLDRVLYVARRGGTRRVEEILDVSSLRQSG